MTESGEPDVILYPPGRNVALTRDGTLVPTGPRQLSPSEIVSQIREVVARKYTGEDETKWGMSLLEAALVSAAEKAAEGDLDALNKILDRLLGKPIQQTIQATGTLREFLDELANADTGPTRGIDPLSE